MTTKNLPKLDMDLTDVDGNAFAILGLFNKTARNAGWSRADIDAVVEEAMSGDYDHLLQTILKYTT